MTANSILERAISKENIFLTTDWQWSRNSFSTMLCSSVMLIRNCPRVMIWAKYIQKLFFFFQHYTWALEMCQLNKTCCSHLRMLTCHWDPVPNANPIDPRDLMSSSPLWCVCATISWNNSWLALQSITEVILPPWSFSRSNPQLSPSLSKTDGFYLIFSLKPVSQHKIFLWCLFVRLKASGYFRAGDLS